VTDVLADPMLRRCEAAAVAALDELGGAGRSRAEAKVGRVIRVSPCRAGTGVLVLVVSPDPKQ
jgi:hypothetical protein